MNLLAGVRALVRWMSLALLALLILTPLAQIVMRGVFNVPMSGAEELARYFLITLTFVAASYVTAEGGQIRMEELQGMVPPRPRWWLQLGIDPLPVADRLWAQTHPHVSAGPDSTAIAGVAA
jgi:TRAP-type C4-dicarboxylate transport system permease small subunit